MHGSIKRVPYRDREEKIALLEIVAQSKEMSLNQLIGEVLGDYLKGLTLNGALHGIVQNYSGIPVEASTARILAKMDSTADAVKDWRDIAASGAFPDFDTYRRVERMLPETIRVALNHDAEMNGPVIYRTPDDPQRVILKEGFIEVARETITAPFVVTKLHAEPSTEPSPITPTTPSTDNQKEQPSQQQPDTGADLFADDLADAEKIDVK